jgi:RHH-type transcriptional regulator, rel operon repressor / antitoxin RelB
MSIAVQLATHHSCRKIRFAIHVWRKEVAMLAIRLDKELEDRLAAAAKRAGRTKTALARKAIEEYIDELEDIALLEATLADYDPSKNISMAEMRRELGLDA